MIIIAHFFLTPNAISMCVHVFPDASALSESQKENHASRSIRNFPVSYSLKTKSGGFSHKSGKSCIIFVGKNRYSHVIVAKATTTALLILKRCWWRGGKFYNLKEHNPATKNVKNNHQKWLNYQLRSGKINTPGQMLPQPLTSRI
jgi:hypothetical protein